MRERGDAAGAAPVRQRLQPGLQQGYGPDGQGYGCNRYRVTAITDVQRRSNGLRVSGTLSSAAATAAYGYNQGYGNRGYGAANLSFRCNVDYRGDVTNVRVRPIMYVRAIQSHRPDFAEQLSGAEKIVVQPADRPSAPTRRKPSTEAVTNPFAT